ncbi:DUF547 domain-containing protein [Neorhodopirellula lusitana]|uniref:DUF547 domain-containing protein n=1 Tax=Neorhodopirellula lusitana TaxID=445327 RepID=UPI003850980A
MLNVGGVPYSLDQMEHGVLRSMGEPRILFAIVCASRGFPRLLAEAYTAEKLDHQLTVNAKNFFGNANNFAYSPSQKTFQLSSILRWFADDFGNDRAAQLRRITPYLPTREAHDAAMANSVSIAYCEYDWQLNDHATTSR